MKHVTGILTASLLPLSLAMGCGDPNNNEDTGVAEGGNDETGGGQTTSTTTDSAETAGSETAGETGTPAGCADPDSGTRMGVTGDIDADTTLTCDTVWVLESTVFVRNATLTIEPGTTIIGANGSALVIDQTAAIEAAGTAEAPIVMTSAQPAGSRNRGDWGGLVLLGSAPINLEGGVGSAEGFADPPSYGGDNAAHDCGTLRYLRVEWAGFEISAGNELNGITFYACGTDTVVDHVQSHMGQDDGIEMFGGNFDAKYLVVTGAADDSLDMDQGFRGRIQHVLIHQDPSVGDNGFEISNQGTDFTATPLTGPTIANVTMVGSGASGDKSKGITVKEGTEAFIYSSIFVNITNELLLIINAETQAAAEAGGLEVRGSVFFETGGFGVDEGVAWTAPEFTEFINGEDRNTEGDPLLASLAWTSPDVSVPGDSPAASTAATPADSWFDATDYAGAVEPGGSDWTQESWINYGI